ncbi:putative methyltransferase-domain-containing protein [Cokeromyces recurvatus]|uniref:putative methyltransferase-domain-containing protein n=1 Tax=Cokeromyces recurvatus TaxID=90255 RepID=UPI00221E6B84|nr:putative methyltransferase-domain-containing protein [Cokeromyces recurvatus]KAI7899895.1 putative methyltransferase-domain-containing protein [Cokeromyces recurvatus]
MLITSPHTTIELTSSFCGKNSTSSSDNSGHFKKALYRNSKVHRIILSDNIRESNLKLNTWYIVNLKLVTEMGLPVHILPSSTIYNRRLPQQSPLSLCLGPFQLKDGKDVEPLSKTVILWDHLPKNVVNTYRLLPLVKQNQYMMLQEVWDHGTPGKLWDSALVMNYVLNRLFQVDKNYLSGSTILDLSAGVGCIGLSIAKNCNLYQTINPPKIVLTDVEEALQLIRTNQHLNQISTSHVSIERLKWGSTSDIEDIVVKQKYFNYILVSDVLYDTKDFPILIDTFYQLLEKNRNAIILMGYKPRGLSQHEENLFFDTCEKLLEIERLDVESFSHEFIQKRNKSSIITVIGNDDRLLLEHTGVRLYRITWGKKKKKMMYYF